VRFALLAACTVGAPPPPAPVVKPPPTAWQTRCMAALDDMARGLPGDLRTAEIAYDRGNYVSVSAFPPVWHENLSVQITREPGTPVDWQAFNEVLGGSNHIIWHHRTATAEVAILLDGWTIDDADRVRPTLVAGVEPCLL
jgi:hypothetical protein